MLAGIIQTIIMALGIATGNISSNAYKGGNVFNEVEQSQQAPIKRQIDQTTLVNQTHIRQVQWVQIGENNYNQKYYIGTNNNPNLSNQYVNIYNTIYFSNFKNQNNVASGYFVLLMNLTNYTRNTINDISLNQNIRVDNSTGQLLYIEKRIKIWNENDITDGYIDLTLTNNNTTNLIYSQLANYNDNLIDQTTTTQQGYPTASGDHYYWDVDLDYTIQYLEAMTTTTIAMMFAVSSNLDSSASSQIKLGNNNEEDYTTFTITAYLVDVVNLNYEVIDVPGLMYTILTMPFSFISGAFNLTIFPGTPYQLNFSNLLLTLLAIFILLWLIKKVFH